MSRIASDAVTTKTQAMRKVLTFCVLLASSCVSSGGFSSLARPEQNRFNRCNAAIQPTKCPGMNGDRNSTALYNCMTWAKADYAKAPSSADRRDWLADNGCPSSLIDD